MCGIAGYIGIKKNTPNINKIDDCKLSLKGEAQIHLVITKKLLAKILSCLFTQGYLSLI